MSAGMNRQDSLPRITACKPPGLEAIHLACQQLYPNQPNPLQVSAKVKYWLGGPDPLDYISMYSNVGDHSRGIPAHWHYVSFGLSDLHGDGRVHDFGFDLNQSGFGFELTFRLKREPGETSPPTWPATLMQSLARYVFNTDNQLCAGDHVPWYQALDQSESRIQHIIMTEDAQLPSVTSPFGLVHFIQIVGVCEDEMRAAQNWNGPGVLELFRCVHAAGGPWLVTDMRRGETIFDLDPELQDRVDRGIETEGSNLSGVSGRCLWGEPAINSPSGRFPPQPPDPSMDQLSSENLFLPENTESGGGRHNINELSGEKTALPSMMKRQLKYNESLSVEESLELSGVHVINSVNLMLDLEAAKLLPLAFRGRLRHGRHFTYKSTVKDSAVTLMTLGIIGCLVSEHTPFVAHGGWLQVLLPDDLLDLMLFNIEEELCAELEPPRVISWPEHNFSITIMPDQ